MFVVVLVSAVEDDVVAVVCCCFRVCDCLFVLFCYLFCFVGVFFNKYVCVCQGICFCVVPIYIFALYIFLRFPMCMHFTVKVFVFN